MKTLRLGLGALLGLVSGCLDFDAAEKAYCGRSGCLDSPDTTITVAPAANTGANPQLDFISNQAGATFECMLSPIESAFTACTSPKVYTGLALMGAPGYLFQVRAKVGTQVDSTPAQARFDVVPGPTIVITAPTDDSTVGPDVTASFAQDSGVTYTCQLDTEPVVNPCQSGHVFSGQTSAMAHSLTVTGTDGGGLSNSQTVHFIVDDSGPGVLISGDPTANASTFSTLANLTFMPVPASEPAGFSFQCKLDAASTFSACTGLVQGGFLEGAHTLTVRALDRFGNIGTPVTYGWTVQVEDITIVDIRTTTQAPEGTRVKVSDAGVLVTGLTSDRFWIQEDAALPSSGITVSPIAGTYDKSNTSLVAGTNVAVIGTVTQVHGNTTLADAKVTPGDNKTPYPAVDTDRNSVNLLHEYYEGMYMTIGGTVGVGLQCPDGTGDCLVSCFSATPVVTLDDSNFSVILFPSDLDYIDGVLEGTGTSTYDLFVLGGAESPGICYATPQ